MGAIRIKQARVSISIAEGDQILAEKLNPNRRAICPWNLFRQKRRYPVPPEQVTHGGAWTSLGQHIVFFYGKHGKSSPILFFCISNPRLPLTLATTVQLAK
jgi:hypothetical protein